jgi:hypothetical protein
MREGGPPPPATTRALPGGNARRRRGTRRWRRVGHGAARVRPCLSPGRDADHKLTLKRYSPRYLQFSTSCSYISSFYPRIMTLSCRPPREDQGHHRCKRHARYLGVSVVGICRSVYMPIQAARALVLEMVGISRSLYRHVRDAKLWSCERHSNWFLRW